MKRKLPAFFNVVPPKPEANPVRKAMDIARDQPDVLAALRLFASMPPSTGVLANPVRHHHPISCGQTTLDLDIRSFTVRGIVLEEDIVTGKADATRVIMAGLFGKLPDDGESKAFRRFLADCFAAALDEPLQKTAGFMRAFPKAAPDLAIQHWSTLRKAMSADPGVNALRPADELLADMIRAHLGNVAVGACASYMRRLLEASPKTTSSALARSTLRFIRELGSNDPFVIMFSLLLGHEASAAELRILTQLGTIQIHHGSAGSNMVARYFATLHTRSVSDLFTASQMALDCGRHFGAISDMTDFVRQLERTPRARRDEVIRGRILTGNLPTFGHPEIAAAGRDNHLEMDPRPALYLAPLFEALDSGAIAVNTVTRNRAALVERVYQIALVEGVEKSSGSGRLRLTPNTDFGAWLVLEILGIAEADRTLPSYSYRGFGWMMDVREQLQQPIVRPVIPPDPAIVPPSADDSVIPGIISAVHARLESGRAFVSRKEPASSER